MFIPFSLFVLSSLWYKTKASQKSELPSVILYIPPLICEYRTGFLLELEKWEEQEGENQIIFQKEFSATLATRITSLLCMQLLFPPFLC